MLRSESRAFSGALDVGEASEVKGDEDSWLGFNEFGSRDLDVGCYQALSLSYGILWNLRYFSIWLQYCIPGIKSALISETNESPFFLIFSFQLSPY
jgi:hypothetical protein